MTTYHAEAGESLWAAIGRVKYSLSTKSFAAEGVLIISGISLRMRASSNEYDISEKYDLLRKIRQLNGSY